MTVERSPVDLRDLVKKVVSDHAASFSAAGVSLTEQAEEDVAVRGDAVRLTQALTNILGNALKFTPAGRRVFITLGRTQGADGPRAVLVVRDEGCGIAPALVEHVFGPLVQADQPLARSAGGLGLGLAIVRGLVELHGGRVQVHSDGEGYGTTVRVELPAVPAAAPQLGPRDRAISRAKSVLIVEDNPDTAEMLGLVMTELGHEGARRARRDRRPVHHA